MDKLALNNISEEDFDALKKRTEALNYELVNMTTDHYFAIEELGNKMEDQESEIAYKRTNYMEQIAMLEKDIVSLGKKSDRLKASMTVAASATDPFIE